MLKRLILSGISLLAIAGLSQGAQIATQNLSAPHPFTDPGGTPLPGGTGFVALGAVDGGAITDAQISAISDVSGAAALNAAFNQFGSSLQFGASGFDGFFQGDVAQPIPNGNSLIGENIYLVAGSGSGITNSDTLIVWKSTKVFGEDNPTFSETFNLDADALSGDATRLLGGDAQGVTIEVAPGQFADFNGTAGARIIPEPSAFALFGLGLAGLLLRRRR